MNNKKLLYQINFQTKQSSLKKLKDDLFSLYPIPSHNLLVTASKTALSFYRLSTFAFVKKIVFPSVDNLVPFFNSFLAHKNSLYFLKSNLEGRGANQGNPNGISFGQLGIINLETLTLKEEISTKAFNPVSLALFNNSQLFISNSGYWNKQDGVISVYSLKDKSMVSFSTSYSPSKIYMINSHLGVALDQSKAIVHFFNPTTYSYQGTKDFSSHLCKRNLRYSFFSDLEKTKNNIFLLEFNSRCLLTLNETLQTIQHKTPLRFLRGHFDFGLNSF